MPTVPTYDGNQVREAPLQGGIQNADQYTTGSRSMQAMGQGLLEAGAVTDRVVQREAQRTAYDAQSAIQSKYLEFQQQYQKERTNDKAKGLINDVDKWWSEAAANAGKGLDPLSRSIVTKALKQSSLQARAAAGQFEQQQLEVAADTSWNAAKVTAKSTAAANPFVMVPGSDADGNPTMITGVDAALADLRQKNAEYVVRKGLTGTKVLEALNLKDTTELHTQVLQGLARNDPDAARVYFDKYKSEINGEQHAEIQSVVQTSSRQRTAQTFADSVMAQGLELDAALSEARKNYSGEDEVSVVNEIKTRFGEKEVIETRQAKQTAKTAWSQLLAKGSVSGIDPGVMSELRRVAPEEERQMRDWLDAKRRQSKAEAEGQQDPDEFGRFYTYFTMATDPSSAGQFANMDLTKVQPYVSKQHLAQLVALQGGINKNDAKTMQLQTQIKTALNITKSAILQAGIDMTPKEGSKQATEFNNFMGGLTMALTQAQAAQPDKPLTPDQLRSEAMRMLKTSYEQGSGVFGFLRNEKRGYQIATDPALAGKTFIETPYDNIPASVRADLEKAYDKKSPPGGIYGNAAEREAAIERAYQLGKEQGRFK